MRDLELEIPNADAVLSRMKETLSAMAERAQRKAIARAVNRTLNAVKAEAARIARQRYTARPKKLFDDIVVKKATPDTPAGAISIQGRIGVSLIHFKAQPNTPGVRPRGGVSAQVRKAGPRRVKREAGFDRPFVMKKKQGGYGVFVRRHGGKWKDFSKGNMHMLFGASPVQALGKAAEERIQERAGEVFTRRLEHEIEALLSGVAK